jgi:acetylglutamate synthase
MKKNAFFTAFFILFACTFSHAQFTICNKCGETKDGDKLIIEGENKGTWIVKYNLFGHKTTFFRANGDKITLKHDGTKSEKDGLTTRQTTSEDGIWNAEVVYKGHDFVKATLSKK